MINARLEAAKQKLAYRGPFASRRCVIPAGGYYEWCTQADRTRQPFYITPENSDLIAMAGVFEWWRNSDLPDDHPDRWILSASIITTTPADHLAHIHDRMPAMLTHEHSPDWLDRANTDRAALTEIAGYDTAHIAAAIRPRPVSRDVGNVRNNHPGLITSHS